MKIETSKKNVEMLSHYGVNTQDDQYGFTNHINAFESMDNSLASTFSKEESEKYDYLKSKGCTRCIKVAEYFSWSNYKQQQTSGAATFVAVKEREKWTEEGCEIIEIFTIYWKY